MYIGELISLAVAVSWTFTALFAEVASKRMGSLPLNVVRMALSLVFLGSMMWIFTGVLYPLYADGNTWLWLSLSGLVGYVFGDFCLFNAYIQIGSRFGQLFMTLAPLAAAISGWFILGERMSLLAVAGMLVTILGISMSILGRPEDGKHRLTVKLPLRGVLFGIGAGVGQGVGLVLSKVGMNYYSACIPADAVSRFSLLMPFSATFIRAIVGLTGFIVFLCLRKQVSQLVVASQDRVALKYVIGATILGPVVGVGLSLMATQYTETGIAQTIMSLTPIFILAPTYFFYHQKITLHEFLGAIISVAGVSLFFL